MHINQFPAERNDAAACPNACSSLPLHSVSELRQRCIAVL